MKYEKTDTCVCGHIFEDHYIGHFSGKNICAECIVLSHEPEVHKFKLDNLRYVEDLAKEKGLV